MKRITAFLEELRNDNFDGRTYNGFDMLDPNAVEQYTRHLEQLYADAIDALIEHDPRNKKLIVYRYCEIFNKIDLVLPPIPVLEDYGKLNKEEITCQNNYCKCRSLAINKGIAFNEMLAIENSKWDLSASNEDCEIDYEEPSIDESIAKDNQELFIRGVDGLAKFFHKQNNWAQKIINSRVLEKENIQFRVGRSWRFDKQKLLDLIHSKPDFFKGV